MPDELFFMNSHQARALAQHTNTLESFAAWSRTLLLFTDGDRAEEVRGASVDWNHFDMLGARPMLGRTFVRDDAIASRAIILSHGLWVRRFAADPTVVGSTVNMAGRSMVLIGVMGPEHVPMEFDWEAWRTLPLDPEQSAGRGIAGNGRLRDGVSLEEAQEDFRRVVTEIQAETGNIVSDEERAGLTLVPMREWLIGDVGPGLVVLSIAVAFLLLLACANVANLLFAQSGARAREFAVRTALGGTRARVVRQVFIEVLVLSLFGGVLALGMSTISMGWLTSQLPTDLPRAHDVGISPGVVTFTAISALLAALCTGVLPAFRTDAGARAVLAAGSHGSSEGRKRVRVRSLLVGTEMALAVVLVVGAGLMVRTLMSLQSVDPGFDAEGVVTFRPSPPSDRYPVGAELDAYYAALTTQLERLPGVRSVGAIQFLPMTSGGWWSSYQPEGTVYQDGEGRPSTGMRVVREGYFETMGISVVRGRTLTLAGSESDGVTAALLNETLAREAFPDTDAIGREVIFGDGNRVLVVGVVGDVLQSDLRTSSFPEMYIPFGARPWQRMHMVLRVDGDPAATLAAAASSARSLDAEISLLGPRLMTDVVDSTIGNAKLMTSLLTLFGVVGLGLGAVGVYGVTSQVVSEQRREIGIRLALGAEGTSVASRTVLRGMIPVALGVAVGLMGAFLGAGMLESLVFGVETLDIGTFLTAPVALMLVALAALALPALRASRVDPVRTLREE